MSVVQGVVPAYTELQMLGTVVSTATPVDITIPTVNLTTAKTSDDEQTEDEKKAIYGHPLFPLMSLLFEKCEHASQSADCPSSDSFDVDIQTFVHHQEKDHKPFFSEDPDLDALMVKAIQVLRIHLLELEKVNDLCKDFCARYIACLKGKLQSEHLLRIDSDFDEPPYDDEVPQNQNQNFQQQLTVQQVVSPGIVNAGNNLMTLQSGIAQPAAVATLHQGQLVSGGTVYQMVQTPQGLVAQPIQIHTAPIQTQISTTPAVIHGSTRLSQIGVGTTAGQSNSVHQSMQPSMTQTNQLSDSDDDDLSGKKKNKRGVLPKSATSVMKSWLFQHIVHPYPTEDEKRQIASQTNLTLLQVNNWFINARRRILQPMLDASNPEQNKAKKPKTQHRPVPQRFWPESIANIQPQIPVTTVPPTQTDSSKGETNVGSTQQGQSLFTVTEQENPLKAQVEDKTSKKLNNQITDVEAPDKEDPRLVIDSDSSLE